MTERCREGSTSESVEIDDATLDTLSETNDIKSAIAETSQGQKSLANLKRRMMIVKAFKTSSPEKEGKWKDYKADDPETVELSATLKGILEDYTSCSDLVHGMSSLSLKNVQTSVRMLRGKSYERISNKLRPAGQINPLCEYSPEIIPEFNTAPLSVELLSPTPQLQNKDVKSTRRPFKDVKVMREENLKQAIWKASAVRPSSAFERRMQRLATIGSDNLPQPIQNDTTREVSRWPTTSACHHSQFGPKSAERHTLLLREKSPNASKVVHDVIVPKDRSNLYNKVQEFLLTRLQDLPEDAALTSSGYVAVFFEALGLLSDGLTTYKPLLQAIMSELKSVFDVQNQYVKDKEECKLAAAHTKQKLELQLKEKMVEMRAAFEARYVADVEKMRRRADELWDKKEITEKIKAGLEVELETKTKICSNLSQENAKLKCALQEILDQHRKLENVRDDRSKLKDENRQLHEAVAAMIPKDDILVYKEHILEQEKMCNEILKQRDHCKQLLLNMVNETKETIQMAIENEHKKAEKLFEGTHFGSEYVDFLSVANKELAHLSDTLVRVKRLYHKFASKERVCVWKKKFIMEEHWTEFLSINDDDVPQFLRCNLKLVINVPSIKEVNLIIQDVWANFSKVLKLNPNTKLVDFMKCYCEKRFEDAKEMFLFAYNFYFALKRDAMKLDAGCMLSILHGEMLESTYMMMKQQCSDVLKMCAKIDVESTDCIPKSQFVKKLRKLFPLKKQKHFDTLVMRLEDHCSGSEIQYNQLLKPDAQLVACGFSLDLQQQFMEERATYLELCVSCLDAIDTFGCGLLKFNNFKTLFKIIDPGASPDHVESTVLNVINFDRASHCDNSATAKNLTEPFPVAQFIANLRLVPDLKCGTHFDLLKSVDDVKAEYLIESKVNV